MKFVELIICLSGERYLIHVPPSSKAGVLLSVLKDRFLTPYENALLYHFQSGRFLDPEGNLSENGVESGDTLLLYF